MKVIYSRIYKKHAHPTFRLGDNEFILSIFSNTWIFHNLSPRSTTFLDSGRPIVFFKNLSFVLIKIVLKK